MCCAPHDVLIFKWNETQVPLRDILACTDHQPLFGHRVGRLNRTHWLTFMKPAARQQQEGGDAP